MSRKTTLRNLLLCGWLGVVNTKTTTTPLQMLRSNVVIGFRFSSDGVDKVPVSGYIPNIVGTYILCMNEKKESIYE